MSFGRARHVEGLRICRLLDKWYHCLLGECYHNCYGVARGSSYGTEVRCPACSAFWDCATLSCSPDSFIPREAMSMPSGREFPGLLQNRKWHLLVVRKPDSPRIVTFETAWRQTGNCILSSLKQDGACDVRERVSLIFPGSLVAPSFSYWFPIKNASTHK